MELQIIQRKIYDIRGQRVMLDFDLAELYEVETKRLKEAVRRNIERFPDEFMFELTKEEFKILRSQIASSSWGGTWELRLYHNIVSRGCRRFSQIIFINCRNKNLR